MQFIMNVPDDTSLMLGIYLGCCLALMYLLIRVDCAWNRREMDLSHERMRRLVPDYKRSERLQELTLCSVHHELGCVCFLHEKKAPLSLESRQLSEHH